MTGPEVRADLAVAVASALPPEWTVYAAPPEQVSLPAAVVVPRVPYRRAANIGGCEWIYGLAVKLLEARTAGTAGVDSLDILSETVREALYTMPSLAWESTDLGPEPNAPGGVECYGATLNLELYA